MGGRIALAYTVSHPRRVSSLILESSSPGLKTEEERVERKEADRRLAERIIDRRYCQHSSIYGKIFRLFASQKTLS